MKTTLSPVQFSTHAAASRPARALALALSLLAAGKSYAADGVWTGSATPLAWDDSANWSGGVIADGAGFTADFSTVDLVGYTVINLNSQRTIGNLTFGDSNPATAGSWNINNSNSANSLILSGTTPTINVPDLGAGQSASISTDIGGTGGLIKTGAGTLISFGNKSYSGDTLVQAGIFTTTNTIPGGTSESRRALTVSAGATVEFRSVFGDIGIRPSNITGAGTLLKTGSGVALLDGGDSLLSFSAGGLIDIRSGTLKLGNFNSQANSMAGNLAAVVMAAGTTFNLDSTQGVLGSLAGDGIVRAGYFGPRRLTIGTDSTSTTFAGEIRGNTYTANSSPTLIKTGNGALTLTGAVNIRADFGDDVLTVQGGTVESPSTLNLHMTSASQIGVIGSGNGVRFGNAQGDNVVVSQTAGTLTTPYMSIGRQGTASYSLGGSAVANVFELILAETGPSSGSGAVAINIADSAELRVIADGTVVMGQFYGRPVTINQTGGLFGFFEDVAGTVPGGTGVMSFRSGSTSTTYNLLGGTLSLATINRLSGGGFGGGNAIFNLDGGTLRITNSNFTVPNDGATSNSLPPFTFNIGAGGVTFDPYGLSVTFNAPLLHAGEPALDGGLTLAGTNGGGILTLTAANTYTGDTVINSGALVLADGSALTFALGANGISTEVRGTGSVTFGGTFVINRAAADLTNGNTWQLVDNATLSETYGSTFSIVGFTEASGVWTLVDGEYTWTFSEATGALTLDAPVTTTPYATWAAAEGLDGLEGRDPAASADPDADGTVNLLEFALNGDPLVPEGSLTYARALDVGGTSYLTLTLAVRNGAEFAGTPAQASQVIDGITYTIEGTDDFAAWDTAVVEATGTEVTALQATLPVLSSGWTYRTFRTVDALTSTPRVFLRAKVE